MKFPKKHITKLTLTITKAIVMSVVFVAGVSIGIFNILLAKFTETKDDAKTRGTSVESKIHPKNTKNTRNDIGYPEINKR